LAGEADPARKPIGWLQGRCELASKADTSDIWMDQSRHQASGKQ
jgi:hypothetical protein